MAAFIDKVRITVKAGNGGNGAVAFHREKYVANGGPDGGDGGNGGSIVLRVDDNLSTLMDFRYKRKYAAATGMNGEGGRRRGKSGEDLVIPRILSWPRAAAVVGATAILPHLPGRCRALQSPDFLAKAMT